MALRYSTADAMDVTALREALDEPEKNPNWSLSPCRGVTERTA
ncbi:hypothetical protein STRIP9103_04771 [Streptomyces ipomoeae 91-03]|uniref:Uncharacterized protein n=1 Tax=Streptomyces ipomoeae 91-03 TaxID=698759 RepID=L1KNS1_9ACTN|nr:hypothetical protein STRIP9103_04771 [Streptomyces ipomoeae 91-03]